MNSNFAVSVDGSGWNAEVTFLPLFAPQKPNHGEANRFGL